MEKVTTIKKREYYSKCAYIYKYIKGYYNIM